MPALFLATFRIEFSAASACTLGRYSNGSCSTYLSPNQAPYKEVYSQWFLLRRTFSIIPTKGCSDHGLGGNDNRREMLQGSGVSCERAVEASSEQREETLRDQDVE